MNRSDTIQVFEYGWLNVGEKYISVNGKQVEFKSSHFQQLSKYLTANSSCPYYTLYYNRVRFCNYVGVIKIGELTIEVLPKTDKHTEDQAFWQQVLLKMLIVSLKVQAKITTHANIQVRNHNVLDTYLHLFLTEIKLLMRQGLIKKYRKQDGNQTTLKGKLLVHKHITKNLVHAERFYILFQVYDQDNIFNSILFQALHCIQAINASDSLSKGCNSLLLDFPECSAIKISEKLFSRLRYDRKSERYKNVIELARIILLNYHPDISGGSNNILAIMFDMNLLWETYVYYKIKRASIERDKNEEVLGQQKQLFWRHQAGWNLRLKPDILIIKNDGTPSPPTIAIDTKWKYQSGVSIQDVRQMYAYGNFFSARQNYLLYPKNAKKAEGVHTESGHFYRPGMEDITDDLKCGLMFADLLKDNSLNERVGYDILNCIQMDNGFG